MTIVSLALPPGVLAGLADAAGKFAFTAVVLAALTAALLQAVYDIGLRGVLQRGHVKTWIRGKLRKLQDGRQPSVSPKTDGAGIVQQRLVRLAAAGDPRGFYSLPYMQLAGQVAAAVQAELDSPGQRVLVRLFAAQAEAGDLDRVGASPPESWRDEYTSASKSTSEDLASADSDGSRAETSPAFQEAKRRVVFHAERGLDEFQLYLGRRWTRSSYVASVLVTTGLVQLLLLTSGLPMERNAGVLGIALSVAATLLVPAARSLLDRLMGLAR
jgi:hypothetical protein